MCNCRDGSLTCTNRRCSPSDGSVIGNRRRRSEDDEDGEHSKTGTTSGNSKSTSGSRKSKKGPGSRSGPITSDDPCYSCSNEPPYPVCAPDGHTYLSECFAVYCGGHDADDLLTGPCSNYVRIYSLSDSCTLTNESMKPVCRFSPAWLTWLCVTSLLKMGRYYNTTMHHYWDMSV